MELRVIDHRPQAWFLLRGGEDYYLDVNCNQGAVGFSVLVKLTEAEYREYHALGRIFADYFAAKISYWSSDFRERDLNSSLEDQVSEAVARFRNDDPAVP
ncbi:MAG TPA: hypothetical protein VEX86_26790 [Longimicrobium sp.]|nr:hypothetical protein [Longimicrobium sp.]